MARKYRYLHLMRWDSRHDWQVATPDCGSLVFAPRGSYAQTVASLRTIHRQQQAARRHHHVSRMEYSHIKVWSEDKP